MPPPSLVLISQIRSGESANYSKEKLHPSITFPSGRTVTRKISLPWSFSPKLYLLVMNLVFQDNELDTGRARLIRSHSSARFCFELSGNSN